MNSYLFCLTVLLAACFSTKRTSENHPPTEHSAVINLLHHQEEAKVDVMIDGKLFTSYRYHDSMEKPILYPIIAPSGNPVSRGFPYEARPNERVDHPHHVGYWLNYGDVNGLDFWNNSYRISPEDRYRYGEIKHSKFVKMEEGEDASHLSVQMKWQNAAGEGLLEEYTDFRFSVQHGIRIIDRRTRLKALDKKVAFQDNKEGFIAIRVARQLEFPSEKPLLLIDKEGNQMAEKTLNNEGVNGSYLNSEGIKGGKVWGKRAAWVRLSGTIADQVVSIVLIDHPQNIGYPTYWHARTYGLFAANPLGQKVFSKGKEELDFSLKPGEEVTFEYRMLIAEGNEPLVSALIEKLTAF